MKLPRRQFLHLATGAATLPILPRAARAQAYPTRPVRIIVPYLAGGLGDTLARLSGQWLSERLGQPFVIEPTRRRRKYRHRNCRARTRGRLYASLDRFAERYQRNTLREA